MPRGAEGTIATPAGPPTGPGPGHAAPRAPRPSVWQAVLLLAAVGAAYANALGASFQFDDWDVIVRDPRVQGVSAWWSALPGIRPLLKLSYALNHASGLGVVGFHAVNVVLHAVNALLAWALVRRLVVRHRPDPESLHWIPLFAALVFTLHPVQTEAVTYACGRSASLSAGLSLASVLLWARGRERPTEAAGRLEARVLSPLCLALAFGVKESAIVVPAVLVLWVATEPGPGARLRIALRESAVHWLVLLACLAAALSLPAYRSLAATSLATRSPLENLVAQVHGVAYLLGQLVRFDRLNADPALEAVTRLDASGVLLAVALLVPVVAALAGIRRWPLAALGVLWTVVWLLPTSSLAARLDLVNDRQWYGALLGSALLFALAIDWLCRQAPRGRGRSRAGLLAVSLLVLVAGSATHRRNAVYRDELVFWQDVTRKSPGNARAFNNLGIALAERCDLDGAAEAWRHALALEPGFVRAAVNLRLLLEGGAARAERCRVGSAARG